MLRACLITAYRCSSLHLIVVVPCWLSVLGSGRDWHACTYAQIGAHREKGRCAATAGAHAGPAHVTMGFASTFGAGATARPRDPRPARPPVRPPPRPPALPQLRPSGSAAPLRPFNPHAQPWQPQGGRGRLGSRPACPHALQVIRTTICSCFPRGPSS